MNSIRVSISVMGPANCGKTGLITRLKTAAVAYALERKMKIEVVTVETSEHMPVEKVEKLVEVPQCHSS